MGLLTNPLFPHKTFRGRTPLLLGRRTPFPSSKAPGLITTSRSRCVPVCRVGSDSDWGGRSCVRRWRVGAARPPLRGCRTLPAPCRTRADPTAPDWSCAPPDRSSSQIQTADPSRVTVGDLLAENRKFSLPPSHLVPPLGVTSFEFMEKLYGSWN